MVGCSYDDEAIWKEIENVKDRVETLEESVIKTNEDIAALQTIVNALQKNLYVVSVTPNAEGYTIVFSDGTTAEIKNGKDGKFYKTEVKAFIEKFLKYMEAFGDSPDEEKPDIVIVLNQSKKGNKYVNFDLAES